MMIFRGGLDFNTATPEMIQQASEVWNKWMTALAQQGKLLGGRRLQKEGVVISGTKKAISDGPFVEAKEVIGGYVMIAATDIDEALAISHTCPIFNYGGSLELREVIPA